MSREPVKRVRDRQRRRLLAARHEEHRLVDEFVVGQLDRRVRLRLDERCDRVVRRLRLWLVPVDEPLCDASIVRAAASNSAERTGQRRSGNTKSVMLGVNSTLSVPIPSWAPLVRSGSVSQLNSNRVIQQTADGHGVEAFMT